MGWKGTLRSLQAASRADARNAQRRQKQQMRIAAINQASAEVSSFESFIDKITSFHRQYGELINWDEFIKKEEPQKPSISDFNEEAISQAKLDSFKPGFFTKTLGLEDFQRKRLQKRIEKSHTKDSVEYEKALNKYNEDHRIWEENKKLATDVIDGDTEAYKIALEKYNFLGNIEGVHITSSKYGFTKSVTPSISIEIPDISIIPTVIKKQNTSGSLSVREMPISRRNDIYQDFVCSMAIRIGCEFLAIIPVKFVIVNTCLNMINTTTGHKELAPVLSIALARDTIEETALENVDPSDALENFVYKSGFKKSKGFLKIDTLDPESFK